MPLQLPRPDYGAIATRLRKTTKAAALHPYLRLLVLLSTFLALFSAIAIKDESLPAMQSPRHGPRGDRAWDDLRVITERPHPWNSRNNDVVRNHVLTEMQRVAKEYPDVIVEDDRYSMVLDDRKDLITRLSGTGNVTVTYFEGLNVLVRIPGTSSAAGAILLSAHIDSVSTAPGATDDGMGAVSAMELVRYFAQHRTKRDIIVNLNNGEEDFLWGAKAFVNHPWSREVVAFVNLEGAGAGGPALLFRTSNAAVANAYHGTPYPRVSQLGNDFFKSGLIRSETDYIVYEDMNGGFTPGLDVAFFKPRALYHTALDDIRHASRGSLQHMLSTGLNTVSNLANNVGRKDFASGGQPVYFDFLGGNFAEMKLGVMWIWNLILLVVGPWILGAAFYGRITVYGKVMLKGLGVASSAVLGSFIIVLVSMAIFSTTSPALVFAHPTLVLAFSLLLTFTTFYLITRLHYLLRPAIQQSPDDAERVVTWELLVLWYIALFITSIISLVHKIGFVFFVPISFFGTFLAALTTLFEPSTFTEPLLVNDERVNDIEGPDETAPLLGDVGSDDHRDSLDAEDEQLNGLMAPSPKSAMVAQKADWRNWLWLLRFGLMVPLQSLIALEMIAWQILPALNQTITDGTPSAAVFLSIGFFSIIAFANTTPFLLRLPFKSTIVLLAPVFFAMIIAVSAPPLNKFTPLAPFKTFYRSTYNLDTKESRVFLYGMEPFVEDVLGYIPTAKQNGWKCEEFLARGGRMCQYTVPAPIPLTNAKQWFNLSSTIENKTDDHIITKLHISATESRVCFLEFDTYFPPEIAGIGGVRFYPADQQQSLVHEALGNTSIHFEKEKCTTLRMFKRTWDEPFSVLLKFKKDGPGNVTVACAYDEWSPGGGEGVTPSLDEIWRNIPAWAGVTKFTTGLLQVRKSYKIF